MYICIFHSHGKSQTRPSKRTRATSIRNRKEQCSCTRLHRDPQIFTSIHKDSRGFTKTHKDSQEPKGLTRNQKDSYGFTTTHRTHKDSPGRVGIHTDSQEAAVAYWCPEPGDQDSTELHQRSLNFKEKLGITLEIRSARTSCQHSSVRNQKKTNFNRLQAEGHDTPRHATARHATRPEDFSPAGRPAVGSINRHSRPHTASPRLARPLARTNETKRLPSCARIELSPNSHIS